MSESEGGRLSYDSFLISQSTMNKEDFMKFGDVDVLPIHEVFLVKGDSLTKLIIWNDINRPNLAVKFYTVAQSKEDTDAFMLRKQQLSKIGIDSTIKRIRTSLKSIIDIVKASTDFIYAKDEIAKAHIHQLVQYLIKYGEGEDIDESIVMSAYIRVMSLFTRK